MVVACCWWMQRFSSMSSCSGGHVRGAFRRTGSCQWTCSCHALLGLDLRARADNDVGARDRQGLGCLQAQALVASGHQDDLHA